jgi:two-component system sensor histidine kinase/response regulator
MLEFEVRDTGCGISKEQIGRLFTPFFQADSSTTRTTGGTGIAFQLFCSPPLISFVFILFYII